MDDSDEMRKKRESVARKFDRMREREKQGKPLSVMIMPKGGPGQMNDERGFFHISCSMAHFSYGRNHLKEEMCAELGLLDGIDSFEEVFIDDNHMGETK